MVKLSKKKKDEEISAILRYINANDLIKVSQGLRTKDVDDAPRLDKRNYLLALLYHKHKIKGDQLKDIFKFKSRASITGVLGQVYEMSSQKHFLNNTEDVRGLFEFNTAVLKPRVKDKIGPYTVTTPVSFSQVQKLEKRAEMLNISVRQLIRNTLAEAMVNW